MDIFQNPAFSPLLLLQGAAVTVSCLLLWSIFFTLIDTLRRSEKLLVHILAVVLVTLLPGVGLLLYLLIRPSTTVRQRRNEDLLHEIAQKVGIAQMPTEPHAA